MKRNALLFGVLVIACTIPVRSQAGFVNDFVGNSGFTTTGAIDGWVSFAVYDNTVNAGASWLTKLGVSLASVTGTSATGFERNVFFYQIVRDTEGPSEDLYNLTIPQGAFPWNGIGVLSGVVFQDSSGDDVAASGAGTRTTIGDEAGAGSTDTDGTLDTTPETDAFVTNGSVVTPSKVEFLTDGSGSGRFSFLTDSFDDSEHSPVLFLTSHANPNIVTYATVATGGTTTPMPTVSLPVSNPEPGSLVLLGLGMMGGGAGFVWRRRRKKSSPPV